METPGPPPNADDGTARATAHFAARPDAELFYLAQHAARYPPAVGAAAVAELQRRALVPVPAAPSRPQALPSGPAAVWGPALRTLLPSRRFWATPLLLALNAAVWAAMTASGVSATDPTGHDLVRWGSNVSSRTLPGEPWRLLTSVFVHGGAAHMLLNALSLWLLGVLLEARVGTARLLAVYLASGVAGSLATLWYHHDGINSVGASGAIFGLYGFLLALLLGRKLALDKFDRRAMLGLVVYLVLSNLIAGLSGNVDNAAHLGGLLMGALVAGPLASIGLKPAAE